MMHETKGGNEGRQGEEDYYVKQNLYPSYIPLCCHVCFFVSITVYEYWECRLQCKIITSFYKYNFLKGPTQCTRLPAFAKFEKGLMYAALSLQAGRLFPRL